MFDHFFGAILGLMKGCARCLMFLGFCALNIIGSLAYFLKNMLMFLIGTGAAIYHGFSHFLTSPLDPFRFLMNTLLLGVVVTPAILIEAAFGLVINSLSFAFDLSLNVLYSGLITLASPFLSLIDGAINGFSAPPPKPPQQAHSNIQSALEQGYYAQDLPVNLILPQTNNDIKYGQNTFFASLRVEDIEDSFPLTCSSYSLAF